MSPYLKFWELQKPLFARAEPADLLWIPERLLAPLERMVEGLQQEQALALVSGEAGVGKTALLRWLAARLPAATHDLFVTTLMRREDAPGWLLPRLAERLGASVPKGVSDPFPALVREVARRLDDYVEAGRRLVLVVDQAHLAEDPRALDEIAALMSLEAMGGACLSYVLCGAESLTRLVQETPALAPRVAFDLRVPSLTMEETRAYVEHRVRAARAAVAFDREALDVIHATARGVIAAINLHAEACLVEAYQRGTRVLGANVALAAGARPESAAAQAAGLPEAPLPHDLPPPPEATAPRARASAPRPPAQDERDPARAENASIKLQSLFKSEPSRQKP